MSASIIDGKATAKEIKQEVAKKAEVYAAEFGRKPGLAVVIVGDDPASRVYVTERKRRVQKLDCCLRSMPFPKRPLRKSFSASWTD